MTVLIRKGLLNRQGFTLAMTNQVVTATGLHDRNTRGLLSDDHREHQQPEDRAARRHVTSLVGIVDRGVYVVQKEVGWKLLTVLFPRLPD